jgi:hypothetical protein
MIDVPRRINVDDLHKLVSTLRDDVRNDDNERTVSIANTVIAHFLGRKWCESHIRHDVPKPSFLRMDFSSDSRRKATVFRVIDLAEMLFNLQHIEGFDACIGQMKAAAEKIESTCAELDFGRSLYINDIDFRFVIPQQTKGKDYDVELFYPDGLAVPADAKCKFETTEINPQSILNSLEKARKQLPDDRPSIIFLKVPQSWVADVAMAVQMVDVGHKFMGNTDRIVSIKFYVSHLETGDNMLRHRFAFREITNEASRFHDGRNWDLFKENSVPQSWNGMPPKWQRILFFPNST